MMPRLPLTQKESAERIPVFRPERLKKCFETAHPDFLYHWHEEINAVLKRINRSDVLLCNGCGYGRNIPELARAAKFVIGTDPCRDCIRYGRQWLRYLQNALMLEMTAPAMPFADHCFNKILCLNNTFSLLHGDPEPLLREFLRVLKKGGEIILSVYTGRYWAELLAWYEIQSQNHILSEIDYVRTRPGLLICKDGHSLQTLTPELVSRWPVFMETEKQIEPVNEICSFIIFRKRPDTIQITEC